MMSDKAQSIPEFDYELICKYYSKLHRQGPGSPDITVKALNFIEGLDDGSAIADIGCGTGGQTIVLAQHAPGTVTGLDLFPLFIDLFNKNAETLNLQDRVTGVVGSMDALPFKEESLDLIWSEGAIYNIGFEQGLKEWNKFLKPGGTIAVSEASWFTEERPAEIEEFWNTEYPDIDTVPNKTAQLKKVGYDPVASFILPKTCWTDHFYAPQIAVQEAFLEENKDNQAVAEFIENQRHEARLYDKYKEFYGYAFYIGKKLN